MEDSTQNLKRLLDGKDPEVNSKDQRLDGTMKITQQISTWKDRGVK